MPTLEAVKVKVADEVWLAAALLHKENPSREDFAAEEIVARAAEESVVQERRPGVYVHVIQHCVANRPPNPGRYRMLYETKPGYRRLFRKGDTYDPAREGSKSVPDAAEIPSRYGDLLRWYEQWSQQAGGRRSVLNPLKAFYGRGKKLWANEPADEYVARLREGWE
jgi:hypothetical protein